MAQKGSGRSSFFSGCLKLRLGFSPGQIVVEYVLLLLVIVALALLISNTMVSRNPDSPGFLISAWVSILQTIAGDKADDVSN